jgi:hypothetical protein
LEVNRTPFDLSEAESELVAGYTTEYGGFLFGVYYLGEYLHLFFFSLLISSLILGGWELPRFLLVGAYTLFTFSMNIDMEQFYSFVYDLDDIIIDNFPFFGIFLNHYCAFIFENFLIFYEINFIIIKHYIVLKFQTTQDIYEILLYTIFNKTLE